MPPAGRQDPFPPPGPLHSHPTPLLRKDTP